ncbi:MAG: hypothetical protein Q9222_002376 [Ikaeria aurantiellina]
MSGSQEKTECQPSTLTPLSEITQVNSPFTPTIRSQSDHHTSTPTVSHHEETAHDQTSTSRPSAKSPCHEAHLVNPEGTIIECLERESLLQSSFPYLKRKPSDTALSTHSSSTSTISRETEDAEEYGEEYVVIDMAGNPAAASNPPTNDTSSLPASKIPPQAIIKIPTDAQWVAHRLSNYRLYQGDRKAFAKYPEFQGQVRDIINAKRLSSVDPVDFAEFQQAWDVYHDKNEDTVLNELLPFFIKDKRSISIKAGTPEEEDARHVVSYLQSGLVKISNREFQRSCLPLREEGMSIDKKLLDAMAKEDGMTNPKPDRTFGIAISKLESLGNPSAGDLSAPAEIAVWLEVMRGVHHPFFLVEGKSYQGNLLDTQNQACRGGATLVSASRRLLATLGEPDVIGPDTRTFVFSATLAPSIMDIWVHWAELPTQGALPIHHMNKLESKAIDDKANFGLLRKILHNILDWGCGSRLETLRPLLYPAMTNYAERQRKELKQKAWEQKAAAQKAKDEKAGNKRQRLSLEASPSKTGD